MSVLYHIRGKRVFRVLPLILFLLPAGVPALGQDLLALNWRALHPAAEWHAAGCDGHHDARHAQWMPLVSGLTQLRAVPPNRGGQDRHGWLVQSMPVVPQARVRREPTGASPVRGPPTA